MLRLGGPLGWTVVWLLALAGPAMYLVWPGGVTWWAGLVLVLPLLGLALWRHEQKGFDSEYPAGDGGAWAPPSDSGGM